MLIRFQNEKAGVTGLMQANQRTKYTSIPGTMGRLVV